MRIPSSGKPSGFARSRRRTVGLALGATLVVNLFAAGAALADHSGATGEVTIYRGSTVIAGYSDTVASPGNETIYVHLWDLGKRDYGRVVKCWGSDHHAVVILANHYNKIEQCQLGGQLRIQTDALLTGPEMFDTHSNDVTVIISVSATPFPG